MSTGDKNAPVTPEDEAKAAERREREQERVRNLKSVPDDSAPPTARRGTGGGDVTYSRERLLNPLESEAITGHPAHVAAGALYGNPSEYLTAAEATSIIEAWLARPVATEGQV